MSFAAAVGVSIGGPSLDDGLDTVPRLIPWHMQIGADCYLLCCASWGEGGSHAGGLIRRQLNVSVFNCQRSSA